MASVLYVSKPVAPPWNDSGKNLVRDLARHLTRHRATVMVRAGDAPDLGGAARARVYGPAAGGFAPALGDQARVFARLLIDRGHAAWHFFFAPNPRSCAAGRALTRLRRRPAIHTLCSAPRDARAVAPLLFADVNVVLSRHTEQRLLRAGCAQARLRRIPPAISPLPPLDPPARRAARRRLRLPEAAPLVVYPGDLEVGEGARVVLRAARALQADGVHVVMACRAKTPRAASIEAELRAGLAREAPALEVSWLGETPHIHDLLGCADLVALPSADLYAKMDYPLVLLEAMSMGIPVVVAAGSAAEELAEQGAAIAVAPTPEAFAQVAAELLGDRARAQRLGEAGACAVRERYAAAAVVAAYERLYDELL